MWCWQIGQEVFTILAWLKHSHKKKNSLETPVNLRYFHADVENLVVLEPIPYLKDRVVGNRLKDLYIFVWFILQRRSNQLVQVFHLILIITTASSYKDLSLHGSWLKNMIKSSWVAVYLEKSFMSQGIQIGK